MANLEYGLIPFHDKRSLKKEQKMHEGEQGLESESRKEMIMS